MRPSPSRLAPVALLTAVALTGAAAPATALTRRPADTQAPAISAITVNPSPVVLGIKGGGRTNFAVAVRASDLGGVDRVTVGLYDPAESEGRAFRLSRTSGTAADGMWTGTVSLPNNARSGAWSVRAFATDLSSNTTDPDTVYTNFRVALKTRFKGFDVKADPNTGAVTATALLQRFRPGKGWVPFKDRTIALEFQPNGANSFLPVGTTKTGADGTASFANVSANKSGNWRATYAGTTGYATAVSPVDSATINMPAPAPATDPGTTPASGTTRPPAEP